VRSTRLGEALAVTSVAAFAMAVRLPAYRDFPRFRDETSQGLQALSIARGQSLPLTAADPYVSPLFNYCFAMFFKLFGEDPFLPRLAVLACGILTVLVTGLFARDLITSQQGGTHAGKSLVAGVVAAGVLAANPLHVVVNSHVGWSHAATPLFTTLGLWMLWRAVELGTKPALAMAGVAFGVACGTHPTAALLLPGAAVYLARRAPWVFLSAWAWLAVALASLVNAPLVVYNLQTRLGSFGGARRVLSEYGHGRIAPGDLASYIRNVGRQLLMLQQIIAGPLELRLPSPDAALDPLFLVYAGFAVVGLIILSRRPGGVLLLLCAPPLILGLAYLNTSKFEPVPDGRYLSPLLPLAAIALAAVISTIEENAVGRLRMTACLTVAGLLIFQPLLYVGSYYSRAARETPTNQRLVSAVQEILASRQQSEQVLIDSRLNTVTTRSRGADEEGAAFRGLRYLLTAANVPFEVIEIDPATMQSLRASSPRSLVILSSVSSAWLHQATPTQLGLRGLDHRPAELPPPAALFGLFRLEA